MILQTGIMPAGVQYSSRTKRETATKSTEPVRQEGKRDQQENENTNALTSRDSMLLGQ